jgi:hypothetical protein
MMLLQIMRGYEQLKGQGSGLCYFGLRIADCGLGRLLRTHDVAADHAWL